MRDNFQCNTSKCSVGRTTTNRITRRCPRSSHLALEQQRPCNIQYHMFSQGATLLHGAKLLWNTWAPPKVPPLRSMKEPGHHSSVGDMDYRKMMSAPSVIRIPSTLLIYYSMHCPKEVWWLIDLNPRQPLLCRREDLDRYLDKMRSGLQKIPRKDQDCRRYRARGWTPCSCSSLRISGQRETTEFSTDARTLPHKQLAGSELRQKCGSSEA